VVFFFFLSREIRLVVEVDNFWFELVTYCPFFFPFLSLPMYNGETAALVLKFLALFFSWPCFINSKRVRQGAFFSFVLLLCIAPLFSSPPLFSKNKLKCILFFFSS